MFDERSNITKIAQQRDVNRGSVASQSQMIDALTLTLGLGGKWYRHYGAAPCPVCQPERAKHQNALTLTDGEGGRLLMNCKKSGCAFGDIAAAMGLAPGTYAPPDSATIAQRDAKRRAETMKRERQARAVWDEAMPIHGTPAETYLRGRGIDCALPDCLRFHPECWHGATAQRLPALVSRVEGGEGFAVHRIYLRPDGRGKAEVQPAKAMLGCVAGGAVRLEQGHEALAVAEGVETALSLPCGPLRGAVSIWAALSTSGLAGLRLPKSPGRLIIATDGDAPGKAAGHKLAARASALGWAVSMFPAPDGADWNDVLQTMKGAEV